MGTETAALGDRSIKFASVLRRAAPSQLDRLSHWVRFLQSNTLHQKPLWPLQESHISRKRI